MSAARAATAGAALLAVAALSGCSGDKIDAGSVEDKLAGELQQFGEHPDIKCPSGRKAQAGTRFRCAATVDGRRFAIDVSMTARDRFTYRVVAPQR